MSNAAKHFKQYTIKEPSDACVALSSLIVPVIVNLDKYREYYQEAVNLFEKNKGQTAVSSKVYLDINDKLLYRQHEMLRFIADHQKSSLSYKYLRDLLVKNGYLKSELNNNIKKLLDEFLDIRNWSFHNPQSMLVASDEVAQKRVPDELKEFVKLTPQINPVIINRVKDYTIDMLASLVLHIGIRIEQFETILEQMKSDYQELFDSMESRPLVIMPGCDMMEVHYINQYITSDVDDAGSDITQISMAIQKSKYDGTDEKFGEWVIRRKKNAN